MNLVHLDGVEHGCCGPAARADAAEVARIAGHPVRDRATCPASSTATVIDGLRRRARGRPHAQPVRAMQRRDQVRGVPASRRRARDRPRGDRSLRAEPAGRSRRVAPAPWRGPRQGPELHAAHAGAAPAVAVVVPDRRDAEGRDARARRAVRVAGRVQARLPGAVLRPVGRRGRVRPFCGAAARARGRGRGHGRSRRSGRTTGRSRSRWDSAGVWVSRRESAATSSAWMRPRTA